MTTPLVSVIIPFCNEGQNTLWTMQGFVDQFQGWCDFEIIIVSNKSDPEHLEKFSRWVDHPKIPWFRLVEYNDKQSGWQTRNYGASLATGKYLFFCDAHIYPKPNAYRGLVEFHEGWTGIAHCPLCYWIDPTRPNYGYVWQAYKFWGRWTRSLPKSPMGDVPLSGSSSLLIDREVFEEVRGFHPALGIYGGGETYIDLKVQMFGHKVRMAIDHHIYHLSETRGYRWNNENFRFNKMLAAFTIGGEKYLKTVFDHFIFCDEGREQYQEQTVKSRGQAISLGAEDREWTEENAMYTLDEVVETWDEDRIATKVTDL
jgi:glycosyltransferase involved in cell wall biosynthesis